MSDLKDYIVFFKNGKTINIKAHSFTWDNVNKTVKFYLCEDDYDDDAELISIFHIDSLIGVSEVSEDNSEDTTKLITTDKTNNESICYKCIHHPDCFDFKQYEHICGCDNFSQRFFPVLYPEVETACKTCANKEECYAKVKTNEYMLVKCDGYKESKDEVN